MIGEVLGNFKVVSRLGKGGMGEVFLAEHTSIQTKVAIKVLHEEISRDTDHVQRFFNEARIVGRIKHAGIVKIFDVGFFQGHAYLIMELLEGESLAGRLQRTGPMAGAQLSDLCRQIASILETTHRAGITHRDLKPDNIFIIADDEIASGERIKILDFGIAKLTGTLAGASPKTQGTMGTPAYMAPEQWGDSSRVDWRADAYSLGCVAFEMACGRPPFEVRNIAEACANHLHTAPPAPRDTCPHLPPKFDALIARLLAKRPEDRGGSMAEIAVGFETLDGEVALRRDSGKTAAATSSPAISSPGVAPTIGGVAPTIGGMAPTIGVATANPSSSGYGAVTTMGSSRGEITDPGELNARRRRPIGAIIGGVAVLAVAGLVGFVVTRGDSNEPKPSVTPPLAAAAPVDAAPVIVPPSIDAAPSEITLHIESDPPGAGVFRSFDGVRVGVTPADVSVARGTGELGLVVKKPGYGDQPIELSIAVSGTKHVTLVKDAVATRSPPKVIKTPKPVPVVPLKQPATPPVERKKGDVSTNPYEKN